MNKPITKLKALKSGAALTPEQRAWVKQLSSFTGAPAAAKAGSENAGAASGGKQRAGQGPDTVASSGEKSALFGGLIPFIPDIIPDAVTSKITIKNESDKALRIVAGSAKVETKPAGFVKSPPLDIPAGKDREFSVSNALIGKIPAPVGTGGQVEYDVLGDEKKTRLFMQWERGFVLPSRTTIQKVTPKDEDKFTLEGFNSGGDDFAFIFTSTGGASPPPPPGPAPQEVPSSCLITVTNNTTLELKLSEQGHDRGDFMTFPPQTVQPGASAQFVSVETPHSKEQGCKGFVSWEVGSPVAAIWRVEWDNPEQAKNTAKSSLEPQTAGFKGLAQIGQGEDNVPVNFTISGGGEGPGPGPGPGPTPGPEPEFVPPVEQRQPTLRKGDKSKDGWVEYLQLLLNHHKIANLELDGNFGPATLKAVISFQTKKKLQVDGTVGNQTWAALREGAPEKPSTDGRQPHTYVEEGPEARWSTEEDAVVYSSDKDRMDLIVVSVGDADIEGYEATVRVTPPDTKSKVVKLRIPKRGHANKSGDGGVYYLQLANFRKNFPAKNPAAKVEDYKVEAYLEQKLGGDTWAGKRIRIAK